MFREEKGGGGGVGKRVGRRENVTEKDKGGVGRNKRSWKGKRVREEPLGMCKQQKHKCLCFTEHAV